DAAPAIARAGEETMTLLEKEGAKLVPVQLPLARFAPAIGYVIIGLETRAAHREDWRDHADEMSHDLQLTFATLQELMAVDYLDALRLRAGLRREMCATFAEIDLLALPSTASTAVRASDAEMASGFLDTATLDAFCRFA